MRVTRHRKERKKSLRYGLAGTECTSERRRRECEEKNVRTMSTMGAGTRGTGSTRSTLALLACQTSSTPPQLPFSVPPQPTPTANHNNHNIHTVFPEFRTGHPPKPFCGMNVVYGTRIPSGRCEVRGERCRRIDRWCDSTAFCAMLHPSTLSRQTLHTRCLNTRLHTTTT